MLREHAFFMSDIVLKGKEINFKQSLTVSS